MNKQDNYIDNFIQRRDLFHRNFPIKIGKQRADVNSIEILKNSCPVCGYLTLDERNSFEICGICFWEDDGVDDFEEDIDSGPNHMTLKEGRKIFQEAKRKLLSTNVGYDSLIGTVKAKFLKLDKLIEQTNFDKDEIVRQQGEILNLLKENKVYGLEKLFEK